MEQLKAFLEKAGADSELTVKLEKLYESANVSEELIAIAAEFGFTITAEEIGETKSLTKRNELEEEKLEAVAGGSGGEEQSEGIAGWTVNRYCSSWCKNLKEARWACYFPVFWCDHFRRDFIKGNVFYNYYYYGCAKGAYPRYIVEEAGEFEP